jgi:hypothetical protein
VALSFNTVVRTRATVAAAGTSVLPDIVVPDNCKTIIFYNRDPTGGGNILISQGAAGGAIADDGSATVIVPQGALTWEIGTITQRVDDLSDLIYDCSAGAANCDITYLCKSGRT